MALRFDNQTVVVTGVSNGLGHLYPTYFASRGANVVVHDHRNKGLVDAVINSIEGVGGRAVADYSLPENGGKVIENAIRKFGRVDILINNSGCLSNPIWSETNQDDWDTLLRDNFKLLYKCTHAAWPYFKKQKYGRVICTASTEEGASENSILQDTTKFGQLGFIQTIAREGAKYNVLASTLALPRIPSDESKSASSVRKGVLCSLSTLVHRSNQSETGHLYEVHGTRCRKLRWQRAAGTWLNPDSGMSSGSILSRWQDVNDFSKPEYPSSSRDFQQVVATTRNLPPNSPGKNITFDGKVVLITGAGSGLGRAYALYFGMLGARIILNDLKEPSSVAAEIRSTGGEAHTVTCSVSEGSRIVAEAIQAYGRLDVIVNNAGIVQDKSIANMTDDLWDSILDVHLNGMFKVTKAAWEHFIRQGYGRVINISSTSGIYGNFGQSNYSLAKCAIVGFSQALAREGAQHNILVNAVAPVASTPGLAGAIEGSSTAILPQYSAPFVALMCSDSVSYPSTGGVFEIGGGWHARTRLEANKGIDWQDNDWSASESTGTAMQTLSKFNDDDAHLYPEDEGNALQIINQHAQELITLSRIEKVKQAQPEGSHFSYTKKDAILYNLTVGARRWELPLVYERDKDFQVLPTFGTIPWFGAKLPFTFGGILPGWNPLKLLHGEIYLEIRKYPIPPECQLITYPRLLHVVDKKKAAIVTVSYTTRDRVTGEDIFYNESSSYIRDAGNFGGPSDAPRKGNSVALSNLQPSGPADFEREETTTAEQAAFYRLNGDTNDLHIDPAVAHRSGFQRPILHGLCFFGISGKHIFQRYGPYKNIRARFAGTVEPGQTLRTEAWKAVKDNVVLFQTRVVETGKLCITGGQAELRGPEANEKCRL
ncbi:uncharacterized protein A1O9_02588 [Exophiala aquamarina CBS 119918]|uniref:Ketoreductase domain-containing protein n=1 Tax=Exophiala aquamarina CBS 119918 TaxID=1182545 RepID=A0A072PLP4_9EURO|nr:uncharacterized protein A1O9_02588 [Exophiala aquamarina CBS 119918]KEF61024.1 hypothetical protein A1O9_02588 [Exophiala aquamarina CBS 119918]